MRLRRLLISLHKWIGLTIAVFLGIQCVTGLMLVYRAELHTFLAGPPSAVSHEDSRRPALSQVVASVSAQYPDSVVSRVIYPALEQQPFTVYLDADGAAQKLVDVRADGNQVEVLSETVPTVLDAIFRLHHVLLIDGDTGRYIVGTTGLVLTFMLTSGAFIWWPGIKRLGRSLAISRYRNPVVFFWQIHRTIGVTGVLLVLTLAMTGVLLSLGPEIRSELEVDQVASEIIVNPALVCDDSVLDAQVQSAHAQFPDSAVRDVRFDSLSGSVARVLFINQTVGGRGPPHQVWLRPCETGIIDVMSGDRHLRAEALLAWTYPVHTGRALGFTGRMLTFLGGVSVLTSVVTGVLIWISRIRLKSAKRREA